MQLPPFMSSNLRRELLAYFFTNPDRKLYLRELSTTLGEDPGNLSRELAGLVREGVFQAEMRGKEKYFSLNRDYPLYKELEGMVAKTVGVQGKFREALSRIPGIRRAFLYGSFAEGEQTGLSDIDVAVVGNVDEHALGEKIGELERYLAREINYILFSEEEWNRATKERDSFAAHLHGASKIVLAGDDDGV